MNKTKYYLMSLCLMLCAVIIGHFAFSKIGIHSTDEKVTRTVETKIDYNALLETFDSYELTETDNKIYLDAYKRIALDMTELDNLSATVNGENTTNVHYSYEYNSVNNKIYMTVTFTELEEAVSTETFEGSVFYNEDMTVNAVFYIEGEYITLSELADLGTLQNCGLFSSLLKVVKVVATVVAVTAVVVAVATVVVSTAGTGAVALAGIGAATIGVGAGVGVGVASTALTVAVIAAGIAITATFADVWFEDRLVRVEVLTDVLRATLAVNRFYLAVGTSDGGMLISPVPLLDVNIAANAMKVGMSTYSLDGASAYAVAQKAGNGGTPVYDNAHKIGYFNHYHTYNRLPKHSHAFFGAPRLV
jgi:hypothetical protein